MAREHPSIPKTSSSQNQENPFDDESDDEEMTVSQQKKKAQMSAKKQSAPKDTSRLFVKKVNGGEESIQFYIVETSIDPDVAEELRDRIEECGGELVDDRPEQGYTLVDPRTEDGELEMSSHSTPTRRVVSFRMIQESIKRGSLVPPVELCLFIKADKPVKFHLHESLNNNEVGPLRDDILLRGGNPDVELSETQVVIHSKEFRDKIMVNRRWRQIELFETSNWLKSCMLMKRFSMSGAGGRLTVPPEPRAVPRAQPGRKPGAPRNDFTEQDDRCLVAWMAYQFGKNQAGRQGNRPYQVLVQEADQLWWTHRHTWHSWRERYKKKKAHLDPLIIQAVNEREANRSPSQRQLREPTFPISEDEDSDEQEAVAPVAGPSKAKARPKVVKRKAQDTGNTDDEQPAPAPAKQIQRAAKKIKVGSRPERGPVIKTSASQKAREAPPLRTPSPPPSRPQSSPYRPQSPYRAPSPPNPVSPPAATEPSREESLVTQPDDDQREDSQSSTQFENGIIDQAVLGGGARAAMERYKAEVDMMNAEDPEEDEEEYTPDDPDVDVVGVTQVDMSLPTDIPRDEDEGSEMESTGKSNEDEAGETGETVLDTIEERLSALADGYGAHYSKVEAYYELGLKNGMGEITAFEYAEKQLRANSRLEKGKGRAS